MRARSVNPSWKQGFARNAAQSAYPNRWKGLGGAWVPALGVTGGTLFDVSGRKNHGTLTDGPTWVATEKGWATAFNSSLNRITMPSSLPITYPQTLTMLMRRDGAIPSNGQAAEWESTSFDDWRLYSTVNTNLKWQLSDSDRTFVAGSDFTLTLGQWHMMTLVIPSSTTDAGIYWDGNLHETLSPPNGTWRPEWFKFIGGNDAANQQSNCTVAATLLHVRALALSEIADQYANPLGMFQLRRRAQVGVAGAPVAGKPTMYYQQMSMGAA